MPDQAQQQLKGAGTQQGWLAVHQELALGGQKLKTVKAVRIGQTMLSGMAGNRFIMTLTSLGRNAPEVAHGAYFLTGINVPAGTGTAVTLFCGEPSISRSE